MRRLIEEQAVIDCLTNTAKYYEREDADEWTKGIHYGLLHGLDNILDNVSPVEAIPKDQYKSDMIAVLEELQAEIREMSGMCTEIHGSEWNMKNVIDTQEVLILLKQKIDRLKGE